MQIFDSPTRWKQQRLSLPNHETLGVVMTMGALHVGHMKLIETSQKNHHKTLVTIFVNPHQFNDTSDFDNYPSQLDKDIALLQEQGVDFLFTPEAHSIYPSNETFQIVENQLSKQLCGVSRQGHFEGMLTVVMKLLNIAQADAAYFGEKDFQQLQLIQNMAKSFFIDTQIIGCPTVRESNGLALSSRNQRLSSSGKELAEKFVTIFHSNSSLPIIETKLKELSINIDYLHEINDRRFIAVTIDNVRLIDNYALS